MKENDEITGLFRSRLDGAEMTVREGFWEKLQSDLPQSTSAGRPKTFLTPRFYRITAAASVVFVLGAASAAFWYFSPKEEIQEAFTQVAAMTPDGNIKGDVVQENFPSIHQPHPTAQKPGIKHPANGAPTGMVADADDESVSVHVSITITQRVYGNSHQQSGNGFYNRNSGQNGSYQPETDNTNTNSDINSAVASNEESSATQSGAASNLRKWAIKAALGTSLPKGNFNMPLTAGVSMERRLNKYLSLEAGLQYSGLSGNGTTLHTLGIPVKLNAVLASTPKVDFYATIGGAVEKCIAGAVDNGFDAEPAQLSVAAGLGVRYKMNDRFALFAEPSVSHHFDTGSKTRTLHTERPTNMNLLCGVRMTY